MSAGLHPRANTPRRPPYRRRVRAYTYFLRLPKDPPRLPNQQGTGGTFNFQLRIAFWFGMAMCDTESAPEFTKTCVPDTDANIFDSPDPNDPRYIGEHPGTAFMEMQFYPPGWVAWPPGTSCDATKWCAALTVDSFSQDQNTGTANNADCLDKAGIEPVNFAFITRNGRSHAPADPLLSTVATFTPDPATDLFMNSGDDLVVRMHDTSAGFRVDIVDLTSGQTGSMTASVANRFGQVLFEPASQTCHSRPYAFHPTYATSSEHTRVPWAAHSYNVAFSDEIGHFEYCAAVDSEGGTRTAPGPEDPTADADDVGCYSAASSTRIKIGGCLGADEDFDGTSYQRVWPGSTTPANDALLHPQSVLFSSPRFNGFHQFRRDGLRGRPAPDRGCRLDRPAVPAVRPEHRRELREPATGRPVLPLVHHPPDRLGLRLAARWGQHPGYQGDVRRQLDHRVRAAAHADLSGPGQHAGHQDQRLPSGTGPQPLLADPRAGRVSSGTPARLGGRGGRGSTGAATDPPEAEAGQQSSEHDED